MITKSDINGIPDQPDPEIGYRLVNKGEKRAEGIKRWAENCWMASSASLEKPIDPREIYEVPLNDGYDYFKEGDTAVMPWDEMIGGHDLTWGPIGPIYPGLGKTNKVPLRRLKATPVPAKFSGSIRWKEYMGGPEYISTAALTKEQWNALVTLSRIE